MALTYRLHALQLLSDWSYRNNILALGRQGYRSGEPAGMEHERSLLFAKVFLGQSGARNFKEAVAATNLTPGVIGQLTFDVRPTLAAKRLEPTSAHRDENAVAYAALRVVRGS
ncbi:hypothetical protein Kisp02_08040 [Kineosporia sp. NBRC 101731]|nr:hypothetical protein Kisp02_08040 [Kineosporia sp. NBRC 101731]